MPLWMYEIEGGRPLQGTVRVSGSKNTSLPLMAAALLADGPVTLHGFPLLRDTVQMIKLLEHLGARCRFDSGSLVIDPAGFSTDYVPYELMRQMRASFYAMGPMLARLGKARVSLPGGCAIGDRPVDLHLRGFRALGTNLTTRAGYIHAVHHGLSGSHMSLAGAFGSSVGATINVLMAAVLAKGTTVIHDAAREPEVVDTGNFLRAMGARIEGLGTGELTVEGVRSLRGIEWRVPSDRIEAGTWAVAALVTNGDVVLDGAEPEAMRPTLDELRIWGAEVTEVGTRKLRVRRGLGRGHELQITTLPFPGFPTDMQSAFTTLLSLTPGVSTITETIYPDRFKHVPELNRMGAMISRERSGVRIEGVERLEGAAVMASDLRAGAALVLAALAAAGGSQVRRTYHVERGYENLEQKIAKLGGRISKTQETDVDPGLAATLVDNIDEEVAALSALHQTD